MVKSERCNGCRYQNGEDCKVRYCAVVRCEMISKGMGIPLEPCTQAGPEPIEEKRATA